MGHLKRKRRLVYIFLSDFVLEFLLSIPLFSFSEMSLPYGWEIYGKLLNSTPPCGMSVCNSHVSTDRCETKHLPRASCFEEFLALNGICVLMRMVSHLLFDVEHFQPCLLRISLGPTPTMSSNKLFSSD